MREMVLNHASVSVPHMDRGAVSEWLRDVASGMGQVVRDKVVHSSLRMVRGLQETQCMPGCSLFDAFNTLRIQGYRDEYVFLLRLATKTPLLNEVGVEIADRFHACEERTLPAGDGEPLVLCAIADWIAVGFPSDPIWDRDRITIRFDELLTDATIGQASEEIDQLTRSRHAGPICDRHRDRIRAGSGPVAYWENRGAIFPNLLFGPGVEENLKDSSHLFHTIIRKLVDLNRSAEEWQAMGGPAPRWRTRVSPESTERMKNADFRAARRFRSHQGTMEMFEWHARYGDSGRIHLRFDPETREVEIGYIGPHLPS